MDSERAETYLRLLAESQLRRARAGGPEVAPDCAKRVHVVARAFAGAGALAWELAESIVFDLDTALVYRALTKEAAPGRRTGQAGGGRVTAGQVTMTPGGQVLRLADADIYVLAVTRMPARTLLTLATAVPAGIPRFPVNLTAVDPAGTSYRLKLTSSGSTAGWEYWTLEVVSDPAQGIAWLDISYAGRAARVNLTPERVAVYPASLGPGEVYLQARAELMIASATGQIAGGLTGLAAVVPALTDVGALPADSVAAGRVRWLCERFGADGHGLTCPPAQPPDRWSDLLTYQEGRWGGAGTNPGGESQPGTADSAAAVATLGLALPEVDGRVTALAVLVTDNDRTTIHGATAGPPVAGQGDWPMYWLRDDGGRWHAARHRVSGGNRTGVAWFQAEMVPPLPTSAGSADIMVMGRTAEVYASVPLTWWTS